MHSARKQAKLTKLARIFQCHAKKSECTNVVVLVNNGVAGVHSSADLKWTVAVDWSSRGLPWRLSIGLISALEAEEVNGSEGVVLKGVAGKALRENSTLRQHYTVE